MSRSLEAMSTRREVLELIGGLGLASLTTAGVAGGVIGAIEIIAANDPLPYAPTQRPDLTMPDLSNTDNIHLDNTKITYEQGTSIPQDFLDTVGKFTPFGLSDITIAPPTNNDIFSVEENGKMTISPIQVNSSGSSQREILTMLMCGTSLFRISPSSEHGGPYSKKDIFLNAYQRTIAPSPNIMTNNYQDIYDQALALPDDRVPELSTDDSVDDIKSPERLFAEYLILMSCAGESLTTSAFPMVLHGINISSTPVLDLTRSVGDMLKELNPDPAALTTLFPLVKNLERMGYLSRDFIPYS